MRKSLNFEVEALTYVWVELHRTFTEDYAKMAENSQIFHHLGPALYKSLVRGCR